MKKQTTSTITISMVIFITVLMFTGSVFSKSVKPPVRTITVTLATDEACSKRDVKSLVSTVEKISDLLQKGFGIRFKVKKKIGWTSGTKLNCIDDMTPIFLRAVHGKPTDIVIGLTGRTDLQGEYGLSFYKEGLILVRIIHNSAHFTRALLHEIFHLFGATHDNGMLSIMDRMLRGFKLLEANRKLVVLHRDRDFSGTRFPLHERYLAEAVSIYKEIAKSNAANFLVSRSKNKYISVWQKQHWYESREEYLKRFQQRQRYWRMADVYLCQALFLTEMKKYGEAIQACQEGLRINPGSHQVLNLMGIAYRKSGQLGPAIKCYEAALKRANWAVSIRYNLGIAYWNNRQPLKALNTFRAVVKANPHSADAWNNIGYILSQKNDPEKAVPYFKRALSINPNHSQARINLEKTTALLTAQD